MAQFNVTTTGTPGTVNIDDLHLTLNHPQTIDLINDVVERFTWAEILESDDLQAAIEAGEIICTDDSLNVMNSITLDHINNSLSASGANLSYTPSATQGTVNSDSGTDAVIPAGSSTNASLMLPGDKTKLDFVTVTQLVDLDSLENRQNALITLSGVPALSTDLGTFTGNIISDNVTNKAAFQELESAIEAIAQDGTDHPIIRGDAIQGVPPTALEVPNPISGDTASVFLTDGTFEKWLYTGTWNLAFTLDPNQATNLGYIASPTDGIVTSSTGSNATISLATAVNAGLLAPGDFAKLGFISITQAVDLDALELASHAAATLGVGNDARLSLTGQEFVFDGSDIDSLITLSGVVAGSNNMGTYTGNIITDNQTIKQNIQELETAIESNANVYGTNFNLFESAGVSTTTSTTFQSKISGNTAALEAGDYKITISYTWNHNATQNDFEARFLFDGSAVGQDSGGLLHKQEPKDAAGNDPTGTGSSQRYAYTKVFYVTGVTAGVKAVALDYRTDNNGNASSIWEANIEIIRVQ